MVHTHSATNAPSSDEELASLLSTLAALSKIGLDMTCNCIDITDAIPRVIRAQVDAQVAAQVAAAVNSAVDAALAARPALPLIAVLPRPPTKLTPATLPDTTTTSLTMLSPEAAARASTSSKEAEDQVRGVPDMARKKKDNRMEALQYYRALYNAGQAMTITKAAPVSTAPQAGPSRSYASGIRVNVTVG
ncbi:hypothetical protein B0H16DRAFT_1463203 [Mycena metata]|uniref:Uncharacterized protein n=1 Tax=Mycena metata TaxID=1033252 RepID=A0AAD7ILN2_9AGAR|nr:hypothetical protein B0H16DRAFT_1463203 [Mycena metata]